MKIHLQKLLIFSVFTKFSYLLKTTKKDNLIYTVNTAELISKLLILMKLKPGAKIEAEIKDYDDVFNTWHICQESAWCDGTIHSIKSLVQRYYY